MFIPETNIILYVNYDSIKKPKTHQINKQINKTVFFIASSLFLLKRTPSKLHIRQRTK